MFHFEKFSCHEIIFVMIILLQRKLPEKSAVIDSLIPYLLNPKLPLVLTKAERATTNRHLLELFHILNDFLRIDSLPVKGINIYHNLKNL